MSMGGKTLSLGTKSSNLINCREQLGTPGECPVIGGAESTLVGYQSRLIREEMMKILTYGRVVSSSLQSWCVEFMGCARYCESNELGSWI